MAAVPIAVDGLAIGPYLCGAQCSCYWHVHVEHVRRAGEGGESVCPRACGEASHQLVAALVS
eukprot:15398920-Alexandrium_andersonii.AAC.1